MKLMAVMISALSLISTTWAQGQHTINERKWEPMPTINDITMVAPALKKYAQGPLADLWKRPGLTPRDRSIVTIAAVIARNQTIPTNLLVEFTTGHRLSEQPWAKGWPVEKLAYSWQIAF